MKFTFVTAFILENSMRKFLQKFYYLIQGESVKKMQYFYPNKEVRWQ